MGIKDKIREANDRPSRVIDVPEWDVKLEVRGLTVRQQTDISERGQNGLSSQDIIGEILLATAFDPETGEPAFTREDLAWLVDKSFIAVDRVTTVAAELSGILPGQDEALGKAFSKTLTDSSSSP